MKTAQSKPTQNFNKSFLYILDNVHAFLFITKNFADMKPCSKTQTPTKQSSSISRQYLAGNKVDHINSTQIKPTVTAVGLNALSGSSMLNR